MHRGQQLHALPTLHSQETPTQAHTKAVDKNASMLAKKSRTTAICLTCSPALWCRTSPILEAFAGWERVRTTLTYVEHPARVCYTHYGGQPCAQQSTVPGTRTATFRYIFPVLRSGVACVAWFAYNKSNTIWLLFCMSTTAAVLP